ncbi:MAG: hypothetical protein ACOZEN_06805 [Thermodesulfobacteriota bacterium]
MADENKPGVTPGETDPPREEWKPPTREEWEAAQKALGNWKQTADRFGKKLADIEARQKEADEAEAKRRGEFEALHAKEKVRADQYAARVAAFEAALEGEYGEIVKGWDDETRALVPSTLPVEERLRLARGIAKKLLAATDKGGGPGASPPGSRNTGGPFGGYASEEEWAKRDYASYRAYRDRKK